jgi:TPR repeat protein
MEEAVKWYLRAARQGDKYAQHNLGLYYSRLNQQTLDQESRAIE